VAIDHLWELAYLSLQTPRVLRNRPAAASQAGTPRGIALRAALVRSLGASTFGGASIGGSVVENHSAPIAPRTFLGTAVANNFDETHGATAVLLLQ
jgi:hypothetical protein